MNDAKNSPRQKRSPRRARATGEKAEQSTQAREKILAAAVAEFGAKGYSGARTASIALRAGVNQQLIAYYFGGKQGVLDELRLRWTAGRENVFLPGTSFEERLRLHLDETLDNPDWARLVIWRSLGDDPHRLEGSDPGDVAQRDRIRQGVDDMRRRQLEGELTASVSPEFAILLAHLIAFAPIAMPQLVEDIFQMNPHSHQYRDIVRQQLMRILSTQSQPE